MNKSSISTDHKYVADIGSAVLTFIGYKQTDTLKTEKTCVKQFIRIIFSWINIYEQET